MMRTHGQRIAGIAAWMLAVNGLLAGCESTPNSAMLQTSVSHYEAGRYSMAEQDALAAMKEQRSARQRAEAAYVAGMSSYQLGKPNEATTHLRIAAASRDSQTAGRAEAMLGIIKLELDQPASAATHLDRATELLIGDEREQARRHAATARRLVRTGQTGAFAQRTAQRADPTAGPNMVRTSRATTTTQQQAADNHARFVLQAGAYRDRDRARDALQELSSLAQSSGLGDVRVVPARDERGQPLYLVQMGGFHSRAEAVRARQSLARLDFIVTTNRSMSDAG